MSHLLLIFVAHARPFGEPAPLEAHQRSTQQLLAASRSAAATCSQIMSCHPLCRDTVCFSTISVAGGPLSGSRSQWQSGRLPAAAARCAGRPPAGRARRLRHVLGHARTKPFFSARKKAGEVQGRRAAAEGWRTVSDCTCRVWAGGAATRRAQDAVDFLLSAVDGCRWWAERGAQRWVGAARPFRAAWLISVCRGRSRGWTTSCTTRTCSPRSLTGEGEWERVGDFSRIPGWRAGGLSAGRGRGPGRISVDGVQQIL